MKLSSFDRVAVVGLGKLGLPWACTLASKGIEVVGIDTSPDAVQTVNRAAYCGHEPDVAQLLRQHRQHIRATGDFRAVAETNAAFVIVPTPSDTGQRFSLCHVLPAVETITQVISRECTDEYVIVLVSTVMPLACERSIRPAIDRASGRRVGRGIHLVYCPEFVAVVIATPAEEYHALDPSLLSDHTIVDCWRHLSAETLKQCLSSSNVRGFTYVPFGIGEQRRPAAEGIVGPTHKCKHSDYSQWSVNNRDMASAHPAESEP